MSPTTAEAITEPHPPVTGAAFSWPLLTLRDSALRHNIELMAEVCRRHGVAHAPHVKTAMSPELFARQLDAGAWGATVANSAQLRTVRAWAGGLAHYATRDGMRDGFRAEQRVFLANELLDPRDAAWLREEIEASLTAGGGRPCGLEVWLNVDSSTGVRVLADAFADAPTAVLARLGVLIEVGVAGGRTGVRSPAQAVELAVEAAQAGLRVRGVTGYEGSAASGTSREDLAKVADFCASLRAAAGLVATELIPDGESIVISAGGSSFLDVVLSELPADLTVVTHGTGEPGAAAAQSVRTVPVDVVVRSGAYAIHDHGFCARMDPWGRIPDAAPMQAAATVWGQVLSVPEPGLAIVGVGRRDVSYDIDLPVALARREMRMDGTLCPPMDFAGSDVTALNDQHLFLTVAPGVVIAPGDVIGFGISHPCTLFDKWRVAAVVNHQDEVVELVTTDF